MCFTVNEKQKNFKLANSLQINSKCGIITLVKRLAVLTTSLIALVSSAGGITASAESGQTSYPQNGEFIKTLTFSSLTDYCAEGETFAFAERGETKDAVKIFENGTLTEYAFSDKIVALDYFDGSFYYKNSEGKSFCLPDKECEHTFPETLTRIDAGDFTYRCDNGVWKVADFTNEQFVTLDAGFKNFKKFNDTVYAVKDNLLYKFDGAAETELIFEYFDDSATKKIQICDTQTLLKENYTLAFVNVASGAYLTEVDLTDLTGDYFKTGETAPVQEETCALLLTYTGNAALIAIGSKSYITLKSAVTETSVRCQTSPEFEYATVTGNRIYASPFVIVGTSVLFPATGTIVKIVQKLEHAVLDTPFYEVEYSVKDGENTVTKRGYVTDGFLTEYIIEDNKAPEEIPDPEYSEKNDVRKVLLILVAVVLALAAIGYLTYIATSSKRKKKENQKPEE